MKALLFNNKLHRLAIAKMFGLFSIKGFLGKFGPLELKDLKMPDLKQNDRVIIKTHYSGICDNDLKQIFLEGNTMFQILGQEVVGTIEKTNPLSNLNVGDRVVLNPHSENYKDETGGFAELFSTHDSMVIKMPDEISWEEAILANPFSIAFHSVLKVKPKEGTVCAVYGCGTLGLLTIHILKHLFKNIKVIAIAQFPHQTKMAIQLGADIVLKSKPTSKIVKKIAEICRCNIYYPSWRKPWLIEGVDFLFDTVASKETLEIGIRIVKARTKSDIDEKTGSIIISGNSKPKRFEWTPWYFKEITIIGSNTFTIEKFDGKIEHAYQHYFRFLKEKKINPTPIITHTFPLERYKEALIAAKNEKGSNAIKVLFSYNNGEEKGGN